MNKEQLQGLLNQKYNSENWNKIYGSIFPNVMLFASPKEIKVSEQWVKSFRQRGLVRLDGNQDVAIFEVVLQDGISVQSKRVGLRNLVAKLIDEYQNHGVLAVFDNGSPEYRFTFAAKETKVTREGIEKSETDSKRYTYILGETETCKTAAEQFIKLAEKGTGISLTDLRDAFSVEKLSKQFFNEYKEQYNQFVDYLASQPRILKSVFGDDEKKMRDFVKLLLGRLVFLQFVQKKKWLGVPGKNKDWHSGDFRFLVNAFNSFANKDKFYSDYLEELFFECLNNPNRKNEIFELSGTKVPFLNGGLFENDNAKTKNLNFPAAYFTGLFEFFGKYNFTIDENDPTEKEVGIDPEMLGSIFENLLEDNKDKGAFYTPKEIVHYMCQESLIEYLNTKVNEKQDEGISESIRVFITKRKTDEHILKIVSPLAIALREVKICDPAIGSGAFPMGMLMEIFHAVFELFNANPKILSKEWNMNGWQPNIVKSNIIQHSIYGVDIEKGAVDIARLRFWLSLIVDEEEPKALPNLDYKIVVGNSLVSKLSNDIIDIDWEVKANSVAAKKLQQEIQNNLNKLFNTQKLFFDFNGKKENLKAEIRNLKIDVLISQLQLDKYKYGESSARIGSLFEMTAKELKADKERKQKLTGFDKSVRELQNLKSNPTQQLNFFDWKLDFPEVLNKLLSSNPGFDIVIGNPPYVQIKQIPDEDKQNYIDKFRFATGRFNLFYFFLELTQNLSSEGAINSLIIPDRILLNTQCKEIREWLLREQNILEISSFDESVFENAVVDTIILSYQNKRKTNNYLFSRPNLKVSELVFDNKKKIPFSHFESSPNKQFDISYNIEQSNLISHIRNNSKLLGEISETKDGIIQSKIADILFLKTKENKYCRPLLFGKDVNRFELHFDNHWVNYQPEKMMEIELQRNGGGLRLRKKEIFEKDKILTRQTADKIIATIDTENYYYSNTLHGTSITDKKYDLKYLLAILNSKVIEFYYKSTTAEGGKVFAQIKIEILRQLPIKYTRNQNIFIKIIDEVMHQKALGKETENLEQMINNLVYRLYELKYDEVKIIDPEFPLTQKEYENISLE